MADEKPFTLSDLRGGVNDDDSELQLAPNEMTDCRNIDFRAGACGAKRRGTTGIAMTSSIFANTIVAVWRHTPTNNPANDELWAIDSAGNLDRRVAGVWQGGVARVNDYTTILPAYLDINAVSLHGKLFIASTNNSGLNRLLVWDGTVLRWAGFGQTPAPTAANTAVGGTFDGNRYYRVRYTQQVSGVTVRRSEPSTAVTINPPGSWNGVTVTKPSGTEATSSIYCEGQTHWELEASDDDFLYYRIATTAIGTSTATDTTAYSSSGGTYAAYTLSEAIGEYVPPPAARHLAVDEDRLILGGHSYAANFTAAFVPYDSYVWWTPVSADDGVGNDERIPQETRNFINFDGLDGGGITSIVAGVAGAVRVFKRSRLYKMVRTGVLSSAYDPITESPSRGALPRAAVSGFDEQGNPCTYFLDETSGLCRAGQRGVEDLGRKVKGAWNTRNKAATIPPRIVYYPDLQQVWYSVVLNADTVPSLLFVYETEFNAHVFHNGLPARARSFTLFTDSGGTMRPVLATASEALFPSGTSYLHMADIATDNDNGVAYQAYGDSRPFILGGLYQKFGAHSCVVLGAASTATLQVTLNRDFGLETLSKTVSMAATASENYVVRPVDDLSLSGFTAMKVRIGDASAVAQTWSVDHVAFRPRTEEVRP